MKYDYIVNYDCYGREISKTSLFNIGEWHTFPTEEVYKKNTNVDKFYDKYKHTGFASFKEKKVNVWSNEFIITDYSKISKREYLQLKKNI